MTSEQLSEHDLVEIEGRLQAARHAAPAPWQAFLETKEPIGGGSFVRFGTSDRDDEIYVTLHFGQEQAMSPDPRLDAFVDFVANAGDDVARLLSEVKRLRGST